MIQHTKIWMNECDGTTTTSGRFNIGYVTTQIPHMWLLGPRTSPRRLRSISLIRAVMHTREPDRSRCPRTDDVSPDLQFPLHNKSLTSNPNQTGPAVLPQRTGSPTGGPTGAQEHLAGYKNKWSWASKGSQCKEKRRWLIHCHSPIITRSRSEKK